jgi:hypothetical protein
MTPLSGGLDGGVEIDAHDLGLGRAQIISILVSFPNGLPMPGAIGGWEVSQVGF